MDNSQITARNNFSEEDIYVRVVLFYDDAIKATGWWPGLIKISVLSWASFVWVNTADSSAWASTAYDSPYNSSSYKTTQGLLVEEPTQYWWKVRMHWCKFHTHVAPVGGSFLRLWRARFPTPTSPNSRFRGGKFSS